MNWSFVVSVANMAVCLDVLLDKRPSYLGSKWWVLLFVGNLVMAVVTLAKVHT
jgi:hypothetical protein